MVIMLSSSILVNFDDLPVSDLLCHIENDFLPLVAQTHPETREILSRLTDAGAVVASMSGKRFDALRRVYFSTGCRGGLGAI